MSRFIKVVAPIMEAQLVETAILNILNHQSLIATKAARVCYAAQNDGVMEFGLRRAQGPDSGTYGARAAVIGGCCRNFQRTCRTDFQHSGQRHTRPQLDHEFSGRVHRIQNICRAISDCLHSTSRYL